MTVEYTTGGYWLAEYRSGGIHCIAEGNTEDSAFWSCLDMIAERLASRSGAAK